MEERNELRADFCLHFRKGAVLCGMHLIEGVIDGADAAPHHSLNDIDQISTYGVDYIERIDVLTDVSGVAVTEWESEKWLENVGKEEN